MWLFVFFDLPVKTAEERKKYSRFRKTLLQLGFSMIQYSVYIRFCDDERRSQKFRKIVKNAVPDDGEVRLLAITDKQFGKMEVYYQQNRKKPEKKPEQLLLF